MRFLSYLVKTAKENMRDWKILIFALFFAPCFVFGIYAAFGNANHSYSIIVINNDKTGDESHGKAALKFLKNKCYPDGIPEYKIAVSASLEDSMKMLKNRSADALAVFPEDMTAAINGAASNYAYNPARLKLYGDPRNSRYMMASILLLTDLDIYIKSIVQVKSPLEFDETLIGQGKALTDFDFYVPGIIILALLNVMFTASASLIKEIEKGTIQRLVMSRLKAFEYLSAISVIQIVFCLVSMLLALAAALACGYEFRGSFAAVILIGTISGIGIMGLSMITVSFLKSTYDLMTVGVIPYFVVMFFSGIFFPLPSVRIASIGENIVRLNDFLPLSMSVTALNKILTFNMGVRDIGFELAGIFAVSAIYSLVGLALYRRRHMRLS